MDLDLESARSGDREAMARIVDRHYDAVYRFCARRVGPELAQDAAQETFLSAQKRLKSFGGNAALSTWLFGIAHNHCRNLARRRNKVIAADVPFRERDADRSPGADDPERAIVDREALRAALADLSQDHRDVVILHEVEGMTYQEAAQVLGVPEGTVKSRLHHAFLHLRRALSGAAEVTA
jgi:RNA polymerase sigma-70 factor (ECF subfamily)